MYEGIYHQTLKKISLWMPNIMNDPVQAKLEAFFMKSPKWGFLIQMKMETNFIFENHFVQWA